MSNYSFKVWITSLTVKVHTYLSHLAAVCGGIWAHVYKQIIDIAAQTYADRQEDNTLAVFLLAELQKAVQSQKRGAWPKAQTNMVTAAEASW